MTFNIKKAGLALVAAATIGLSSCTNGFEELNIDPNNPSSVDASFLLTQTQFNLSNLMWGGGLNYGFGMLMVQHWAENEYTDDQRYDYNITSFDGSWSGFYTGSGLSTITEAIRLTEIDENVPTEVIRTNRLATLSIMRAWAFQQMTDCWGSIPYSEALDFTNFQNPGYDSQADIYAGLLSELTSAVNNIDEGSEGFGSGDIVFYGDMAQWKKFGNSLILRMAIRMSDVNDGQAGTFAAQAINSGVMTSNADGAHMYFGSESAIANPMYVNVVINNRDDYSISEELVTHMQAGSGDPRLPMFADEAAGGGYVGMPYGLTDLEASAIKSTTSRPSTANLRSATRPAVWMSYSEVLFLEAEAIQRGYVAGDAAAKYNEAVEASMAEWGITDAAAIATYLTEHAYDAGNWKQSIGTEKWVALYGCGLEAWSEWRRLDVPTLAVPTAAAQPAIPVRLFYSSAETAANLSWGTEQQNNNNMSTKLWWDVN